MSDKVAKNKAVYFTYVVTDEHNQLIEQSDVPFGYVHGVPGPEFEFLPALEQRLENKSVGDRVEVEITPEEGFGHVDPNLIYRDKIENVPEEFRQIGAQAPFQNEHGEQRTFVVTDVSNGMVTLDGNHPYAGKTVKVIVTLMEIRDADPDEIASGKPVDIPPAIFH